MNIAGNSRGGLSINDTFRVGRSGFSPIDKRRESAATPVELNFYATPPSYELSLDEFEELALARLKVRYK